MSEIADKVKVLAANTLREMEIELVDVTYRRENAVQVLRLVVDKKGGVTIDECGLVNEAVGVLLDKENFIAERYTLEVSSPGLDRHLKTKADFDKVNGELVRISTYGPVENKREHVGKVISSTEGEVTIELKETGAVRAIPLNIISKARLEIEF